ncbi:1,2-phenylacetyl-CoA epoxidase subunit PaaC [Streptomyces radicis]|uniref:Phenylacetate-CoA oxygenase subunit PaaI n=1 Tax=Streptomyces radicis TaxID=1750517 RepID=A0A3A9WYU2_9ACTN|nr:1,2-phenylacetyl-CoA epoxidase subunit PaaC [Streptomyces radicis]RKN11347.1 phenylacetate-CoA oxygenase subunit PaaI [Streptomyces radicis]RKN26630.1 phenylacetate-CoA oxygenase subunit PaaI [Streptomyces radicis]
MSAPEHAPGGAPWATAALALGDDALILSHRLAEWAGNAPVLEEEVALANLALDLLGQARALLSLVGDEDALAFTRGPEAFTHVRLVELPRGDFAHTVVRQLCVATWQELLYERLATGASPLAPIAAAALPETAYHRDHAVTWTLRLGDGTAESHARTRAAAEALWPYTGELFDPVEGLDEVDLGALERRWRARVSDVLTRATVPVPGGARLPGSGRAGEHTPHLAALLDEMQSLHRAHPAASW